MEVTRDSVAVDGTILDGGPSFVASATQELSWAPWIVYDGAVFVVGWTIGQWGVGYQYQAVRVQVDGTVIDSAPVSIPIGTQSAGNVAVGASAVGPSGSVLVPATFQVDGGMGATLRFETSCSCFPIPLPRNLMRALTRERRMPAVLRTPAAGAM